MVALDPALIKPFLEALSMLYKGVKTVGQKRKAEKAVTAAIRELLLAPTNLRPAEANIALAKATNIINTDLLLADEMLSKHKVAIKKPTVKKVAAKKPATKKSAVKKVAAKKPHS